MSKIAIWVLVGIIFVGGGYYALNISKNNNADKIENSVTLEDTTDQNTESDSSGKKMAFSDFINLDKNAYKCSVTQYVNNTETVGTFYLNNGLMRGEYNTKVAGLDIDSFFIVRDGYNYSWSPSLPQSAVKIKSVATTTQNPQVDVSGQYVFNGEQIGDYDCQSWNVDESKFTLPSDIVFRELIAPKVEDNKITLIPNNKKASCESQKGTWYEESKVCEINSFSENQCIAKGGEWNGCASACRHDKDAQICTLQCVLTCSFR